jgi:hypothetical protein
MLIPESIHCRLPAELLLRLLPSALEREFLEERGTVIKDLGVPHVSVVKLIQ